MTSLVEGAVSHDFFDNRLWKTVPFSGLCAPDHPFAGRTVSWEELLGETLLLREKGSGTRMIFESQINLRGYSIKSFEKIRDQQPEAHRAVRKSGAGCFLRLRFVLERRSGCIHHGSGNDAGGISLCMAQRNVRRRKRLICSRIFTRIRN